MRFTAILLLTILTFLSCKKETGSGTLDGKWKMIKYYDRNSNSYYTKPDSSDDVFLSIDGDKFTAYSGLYQLISFDPICSGTYTLNGNDITFNTTNSYFAVTNDNWTDMFFWAIQACQLQSLYPCSPSKLEHPFPNQIRINTVLRMDIILMKVQ